MTTSTVQLLKKWLLLYEVITSIVIGYCNMSRFTSLSGNGSEARKTVEAKELVFLKVLVKGFSGYISLFIIEFLHILSRHLSVTFSCLLTQQSAMLLYENVNVQQLSWLVVKNYENSITTLVFEIFWEVYEKPPLYRGRRYGGVTKYYNG